MYLYLILIQQEGEVDTKFSVAVHILVLVAESTEPINSDQMAQSVGTNASYVRKILSLLKKADIIDGHQGVCGYSLNAAPEQLTLLQIYQAVMEQPKPHLLDIHRNANDQCIVGHHILPVLTGLFAEAEQSFARALAEKTVADCIAGIRNRMH